MLSETEKVVSRYHCKHTHDIYKVRGTCLKKQTDGKAFLMNSETHNGGMEQGLAFCVLRSHRGISCSILETYAGFHQEI